MDDTNILFCELELPSIDRSRALAQLALIPANDWVLDAYRNTYILPLMTKDGRSNRESLYDLRGSFEHDFTWTSNCPQVIADYFERHVFTWMNQRPRVTVLRTPAGSSNHPHIDCQPFEFGTRQLKFRYVLQGPVSTLFFIGRDGRIAVPDVEGPFLMDGSWPHGMENTSDVEKVTICVGAPWDGSDHYPPMSHLLVKSNYQLPLDYTGYYRDQTLTVLK